MRDLCRPCQLTVMCGDKPPLKKMAALSLLLVSLFARFAENSESRDASKYGYFHEKRLEDQARVGNYRRQVAEGNLRASRAGRQRGSSPSPSAGSRLEAIQDGEVISLQPGQPARPFTLYTLSGKVSFPHERFSNCSIIFLAYNNHSAFMESLWGSDESLAPLIGDHYPSGTHFVFMSASPAARQDVTWMKRRLWQIADKPNRFGSDRLRKKLKEFEYRFHFVVTPLYEMGNWIPVVFMEWECVDHLCGLDQVLIQSPELEYPFIFKRLDAQYDWLPAAMATLANKTLRLVEAGDGCKQPLPDIAGAVALVSSDNCSYFRKVQTLEQAHAIGILVYTLPGQPIQNMICVGKECDTALHIPASMIPYPLHLLRLRNLTVRYQNTPSDNFFMAIDTEGQLAETGWFLFPSMKFLVWQAQWFNYTRSQAARIRDEALVVPVFKDKVMAGKHGVIVNVSIPPLSELQKYSKFELHMNLSCPGTRDTTCPHWDRVVGLYVCCNSTSPLCNSELGRWISPFRRRIGSWLTDVSPLLPLLSSQKCSFQMSTDPWSMPWVPTVNLRFSGLQQSNGIYPAEAKLLYQPGATFDRNYNSHFEPLHLQAAPTDVVKIVIYAVITGHGNDENGCGEFCITSHHFVVNGNIHSIEFSNAGTPFGCADRVVDGVVPNEHGTWLYGRDGWCDGQQVSPWVIDITDSISHTRPNIIKYYGWFNGTDPNPQKNPGMISLHSYLVFFKNL